MSPFLVEKSVLYNQGFNPAGGVSSHDPSQKAQPDERVQAIAKILYADAAKGQTIGSNEQVPLTRICKKWEVHSSAYAKPKPIDSKDSL